MKYNFRQIESRWQKAWEKKRIFQAKEIRGKKKFYVVPMYPYPSGTSLHMGHAFNYTITDIFARYKRMKGFNVLHPIGFDSFGLPAENAAIKEKSHPKKFTEKAIGNYIKQFKVLGMSYDFSRLLKSHNPEYYKWDQWIFLKMFERGLAYRKKAPVNWCGKCNTVLANEQVIDGKCWRHEDTNVEVRQLEQWFLKITDYADEIYKNTKNLEWPERIRSMQENWIGRSDGTEVLFEINGEKFPIFTTRVDTLFGVTFLVISAQHPQLMELVSKEQRLSVEKFLKKIHSTKQEDMEKLDKEGVFTGTYAKHPLTDEKIPVWVGNFVVADYGSGIVMAVPAHDERDFEFAQKYNLPIKGVIEPLFIANGKEDGILEGKPFVERNAVAIILKHWVEEKYAVLKWKKVAWQTMITGGIEKNQTPEEVAIQEIKEETGYSNPILVKRLGIFHSKFFHGPKNENRFGHFNAFCFKLKNGDRKAVSKSESEKHELQWVQPEKVSGMLTAESHRDLFRRFLQGEKAFTDYGVLTNSREFNGLHSTEAKEHIVIALQRKKLGSKKVNFKLRDWLISRQRFWGTPIPIVYCDKCGIRPVKEKDLPVRLPEKIKLTISKNPLVYYKKFTDTKCPKCKSKARRETDTMDTFVNSSWYFLRYLDPKNKKKIFDTKKVNYWMPMDLYLGGAEHACLHLIYSRFYTKFLRDLGLFRKDISEPARILFNQGMVHGNDGFVMSKSRGNGVDPIKIIKKFGSDTLRLYLVSNASPDKDFNWDDRGIDSISKLIKKIQELFYAKKISGDSSRKFESRINKTIKDVTKDIENLNYNLAVVKIRAIVESFYGEKNVSKNDAENFLKILSVFCPHISEDLWEKMGNKNFISLEKWPNANESKIDLKLEEQEKIIDKLIQDIINVSRILKERNSKSPQKVFVSTIPNEKKIFYEEKNLIEKRTGLKVEIFSVNENIQNKLKEKSKNVKPGKPAIYLE